MELNLTRKSDWYDFELTNERGNLIPIAAATSIGGKDDAFKPMELVAGALAGCSSIDVLNILKKQRIRPDEFNVKVNAIREESEVPAIFKSIELVFHVSAEVDEAKVERAIALSMEKYCSVSKILEPTCVITHRLIQIT